MISIIVAHDDKLGIASTQKLGMLWYISADFKHFKALTLGHPIIMGRKTHESIGRVLPGRTNIVITRDQNLKLPDCLMVNSLEEAIKKAGSGEIFIIGGAEIFRQAMEQNLVDRLYITKVAGDFQADVFFPDYSRFKLLKKTDYTENNYNFSFYVFEKH